PRVFQFVLGLVLSTVLWAIVVPLWAFAAIHMVLAEPSWQSLLAPGLLLIPAAVGITYLVVRHNWARAIGALTFYPFAAMAAYHAYDVYLGRPPAGHVRAPPAQRHRQRGGGRFVRRQDRSRERASELQGRLALDLPALSARPRPGLSAAAQYG